MRRYAVILLAMLLAGAPVGALDLNDGDIVVGNVNLVGGIIMNDGTSSVLRVDPASGSQAVVSLGGLVYPADLAIESSGTLIATGESAGVAAVVRIDPATGSQTLLALGSFFTPFIGLDIDSAGDIFVLDRPGAVWRIDPVTGTKTFIWQAGQLLQNVLPVGSLLAIDRDDQVVVARLAKFFGPVVSRIDPATGSETQVSMAGFLGHPAGVAVEAGGRIVIADGDGRIVLIDPIDGFQTLLSSGGLLLNPTGVEVAANGDLLVSVAGSHVQEIDSGEMILRVDPISGAQSIVSQAGQFLTPTGLDVFPAGIPGSVPGNPLLPTTSGDSFSFVFELPSPEPILMFFDPEVAIGYDYVVDTGPNFGSVVIPDLLADDSFELVVGGFTTTITADVPFDFTTLAAGGVSAFSILGIDPALELDPTDPTAFVTGLSFVGAGHVEFRMTPVIDQSCIGLSPVTTIFTIGGGQSASNNVKVSHSITGNIVSPELLKNTAKRIPVCRGTNVNVSVVDTTGGATNSANSNGISCDASGCTVLDIQATEKYISRSADGKDTDRMTFLPK